MNILSNKIKSMEESQTLAMAKKARQLKNNGLDIVSLSLGEPDFDTPDFIKEGIKKAVDNNFSHYTPVPGLLEVREAVVTKFKRDNNLNFTANQIVLSTGAKQSLAEIMMAILNPEDEVILPAPYWVSYEQMIEMQNGKPVTISTTAQNNYKVTAKEIENCITAKTKAILFSSPCNPSGAVYTKEELKEIADVFKKHPTILIISDEIYELINFDGKHQSIAQFPEIKEQVCIVNGLSKGYAMTGYRLGYIAAPIWLANAVTKVQGQITSATCAVAQKGAETALLEDPKVVAYMRNSFLERRNYMHKELSKISDLILPMPQGAFYLFPDVSAFFGKKSEGKIINNSNDFSTLLLEHNLVATVSGEAFGSPNCIRLSYATSDENLKKAVERITQFINNLEA